MPGGLDYIRILSRAEFCSASAATTAPAVGGTSIAIACSIAGLPKQELSFMVLWHGKLEQLDECWVMGVVSYNVDRDFIESAKHRLCRLCLATLVVVSMRLVREFVLARAPTTPRQSNIFRWQPRAPTP